MKAIFCFLIVMTTSTFANASVSQLERSFKACAVKAQSTLEQNHCSEDAYKTADAELNHIYHAIAVRLQTPDSEGEISAANTESLKRMVLSEDAWIRFRDANCKLEGVQMIGGTGEGSLVSNCLAQTTIDRIKELHSVFAAK